jgi:hypothetical protein
MVFKSEPLSWRPEGGGGSPGLNLNYFLHEAFVPTVLHQ